MYKDTNFELFNHAPVALWEADYSKVYAILQEPWVLEIENLADYLLKNTDQIEQFLLGIEIITVNQTALSLCKANNKEELIQGLAFIYTKNGTSAYINVLEAMQQGLPCVSYKADLQDLDGELHLVDVHVKVMPGHEQDYSRVMFSVSKTLSSPFVSFSKEPNNPVIIEQNVREQQNLKLVKSTIDKSFKYSNAIIENSPDFIAYATPNGRMQYCNHAGKKLLGLAEDEDMSRYVIGDFHTTEHNEHFKKVISPILQEKGFWTGQTELVTHNNKRIPLLQVMIAHKDKQQNITMLSTSAKDISKRLYAEQELLNKQQQVADMYRVLSMSEVASAISHEINQPLTAIANYANGCLRLIKKEPVSEPLKSAIIKISKQVERAGEIVHHINNYLRRGELQVKPLDINQLIQDVLTFPYTDISAVQLNTNFCDASTQVNGDKIYLQQTFVNVINNALEAIREAGEKPGILTVTTQVSHAGLITIMIKDNGVGMSEELCKKIFSPLYTTKQNGTGIGLALARYLIEEHKGKITVASEQGKGSCFNITLPSSL
jgi:two-component system sensor kinase FixL